MSEKGDLSYMTELRAWLDFSAVALVILVGLLVGTMVSQSGILLQTIAVANVVVLWLGGP